MSQLDRGEPSRIMYIESKASGLSGPARIGRVTFSKSGKTVYYRGRLFQSLSGQEVLKANFFGMSDAGDPNAPLGGFAPTTTCSGW